MTHESIEQIEEEIHHTESEMGETIDEIQRRLSPENLAEQAKEMLRGAGNRAGAAVRNTVREKPWLPAVILAGVAGAAAAWYVIRRKKSGAATPVTATAEWGTGDASHQIVHAGSSQKNRYGIGAAGIILGGIMGALIPASTAEAEMYRRLLEKMKTMDEGTGQEQQAHAAEASMAHGPR
ncbi:MAG TPA: DUF3618 domain-containing protein [Verrucomicrobiae bacterium]|nr:DUF3618 domain-containing protein [Verrucomicrobiae bacterium]